jgi:hypothetical protein
MPDINAQQITKLDIDKAEAGCINAIRGMTSIGRAMADIKPVFDHLRSRAAPGIQQANVEYATQYAYALRALSSAYQGRDENMVRVLRDAASAIFRLLPSEGI